MSFWSCSVSRRRVRGVSGRPGPRLLLLGPMLVGGALLAGACSDELSDAIVADVAPVLEVRTGRLDVPLSSEHARCVARSLDENTAEAVLAADPDDGIDPAVAEPLVDGVIECVGEVELARSALVQFGEGAAEESLDCAASRLDADLVRQQFVARFAESGSQPAEVELALVSALSFCLEPSELLDRGG